MVLVAGLETTCLHGPQSVRSLPLRERLQSHSTACSPNIPAQTVQRGCRQQASLPALLRAHCVCVCVWPCWSESGGTADAGQLEVARP